MNLRNRDNCHLLSVIALFLSQPWNSNLLQFQYTKCPPPSTRRLLKESTDLHKNPSPYFTAAPISDTNLHDWHFTLAGPPSPSPYAQGLYHGRITFPATYPLRPPSFRFLTPSGRFEVNREICLSISGHHEETWQPAWGVRTALLGIRSEIFTSESQGQVGGMEGNDEVRREYARLSLGWRCRECGATNLDAMRELWGVCRERGIEVEGEVAGVEGQQETNEAEADADAPAPAPAPSGDTVPIANEDQAKEDDTVESSAAESVLAPSAPTSVPATQAQAQAPISTVQAPVAAVIPTQASSSQLASIESQSESVWLDRAIIGVIVALVLLILRRVANVDDL
ncbi:Ubiquitin-conjugating enzyme E2 [Penicillium cf. griseofulvum]|uniref:Ubiquitin-conjugating enzyme E2 n=1 Tax=Penicillium cf. griseofulvum TaxID=2972120 RepID=A0A9W9JS63_9EURO|nr:Ubiquitin-conjugating enzyme E2 [Penicillium cf. griseofulvum]KAJ5423430.1 Ubiquitin-conjugating enzyme E2 [Penicillium cf. griseofulvum]KAJ5431301.1 Ubiquitin-conjugating enzyme E2 [Penicillium cf. griseofulvum]